MPKYQIIGVESYEEPTGAANQPQKTLVTFLNQEGLVDQITIDGKVPQEKMTDIIIEQVLAKRSKP